MTLSFVFAVVGVALVAYCFIKLSQHISHTGSVYALVGVTRGPRAGFVAGWALMGAYTAIGCGSTIEMGLFGGHFLHDTGILSTHQWWWIALIGLLGVSALAFTEIRIITRALLTSEVIGAILVTILSIVILAKVIFGHGPSGQTFTLNFLSLPSDSGIGTIAKRRYTGSWPSRASRAPRRSARRPQIPRRRSRGRSRRRWWSWAPSVLTAAAQSLGYGATAAGAGAYGAGLPFSDLGGGYIGEWYAESST